MHNTHVLKNKLQLLDVLFALFFSLFVLISLSPYYVWGVYQEFYAFLLFVSAVILVLSNDFRFGRDKCFNFLFVLLITALYYYLSESSLLGVIVFSFSIAFFFLINLNQVKFIFQIFRLVYVFFITPGILLWFYHHIAGDVSLFFLGYADPSVVPNQLKIELGVNYAIYPFMVVLDYMHDQGIYRFSSLFDEPGVVGTIGALMLAADKFNFKNRVNLIILVSGVISLSAAFFIISTIYILLSGGASYKKIILLVLLIFGVYYILGDFFDERVVGRIFNAEDNRNTIGTINQFNSWINGDYSTKLFGLSGFENDGASSWLVILLRSGLVGVFCIVGVYVRIHSIYPKIKSNLYSVFIFIFLLSSYQRPDLLKPIHILLFLFATINLKNLNCDK